MSSLPARRTAALVLAAAAAFGGGCTSRSREGPEEGGGSAALFVEVSRKAGIEAPLVNGARGEHYLIETMLGGLGWLDYDGDGDYDLYVARGHEFPENPDEEGVSGNVLFRNEGGGRFSDVTAGARAGDRRYSFGVAAADYDGDGACDLFVTNFGRNTLYRNRGGVFEDVTEAAGLTERGWSSSAAWFDYDRDGDLDLYVVRYLEYHPRTSRPCIEGGLKVYCHPRFFPGQRDLLYENRGGRFVEVGERAGIARAGPNDGKGLGVIPFDFDGDGWQDIYVANDTTPNFLWRNMQDGTFRDVAFEFGVAVSEEGRPQAGMGVDCADIDGDGLLDLHVTNFSREMNNFYLRRGGGFRDEVVRLGLEGTFLRLGFGTRLADFDLDGRIDVLTANGHVDDMVEEYMPAGGIRYAQPLDLFLQTAPGRFERRRGERIFEVPVVGRGLATADYDGDGDLDAAVATIDRGVLLLENQAASTGRNWLRIRLRGRPPNRDALGALVAVRAGGRTTTYVYQSARSYLSACDPRIVVGLGEVDRVDEIRVRWPLGGETTVRNIPAKREIVIAED